MHIDTTALHDVANTVDHLRETLNQWKKGALPSGSVCLIFDYLLNEVDINDSDMRWAKEKIAEF